MSYRSFPSLMLFAMFVGMSAVAAPTTAPADVQVVTRVYDITDLIWRMNDYPAPAQPSSRGGDMPIADPNKTASSRGQNVDSIVKLIEDTVATSTWRDNGGTIGALRELGGQLIVTQTPENQELLASLFKQLREDRGRMVVIRAYWVLLDPASVPAISSGKSLPVIDDKLIDAKTLYCGAQTMCFSGQTVHVTSGRKRAIVTDLQPVVGNNAVGYDPTIENVRSGVVLQVTPHLEPEGADARMVLDLQSNVTEIGGDSSKKIELPATTQPSDASNMIDRVNEVNQEFRTTVRLPLAKKVLVGGMTLEPAAKDQAGQQLYLVIEADAVK